MISLIVAVDQNNAIGAKGLVPWTCPTDLKFFRKMTKGHTVIMGRKTHESIGLPLGGRRNIVVSSTMASKPNIEVVKTLKDAIRLADVGETFIIGGAQIYKEALDARLAYRLYITRIRAAIPNTDTFMPKPDPYYYQLNAYSAVYRSSHDEYAMTFEEYICEPECRITVRNVWDPFSELK